MVSNMIYDVHSTGEHDLIAQMHAATKIITTTTKIHKCILLGTLIRNRIKKTARFIYLLLLSMALPAYYKIYISLYFWLLNP